MIKPRILIAPGWLDSTNAYAEYIMMYAGDEFCFEKTFFEHANPDDYDLYFPLFATIKQPWEFNFQKTVRIVYEPHEIGLLDEYNPAVTTTCENMFEMVNGRFKEQGQKYFLTPFGIDHHLFRPLKTARTDSLFRIGFVGGLDNPRKNFEDIIKPLGNIADSRLITSNAWAGINGAVIRQWHGMPYFYSQIDALVLGSSFEGLCFPILEAAACGIPIVSTNVGVAKEFEGIFTVDFEIDDDNEMIDKEGVSAQLREKLEFLRDNPEERKRMGEKNREMVLDKWTWKDRIKEFKKFFRGGL